MLIRKLIILLLVFTLVFILWRASDAPLAFWLFPLFLYLAYRYGYRHGRFSPGERMLPETCRSCAAAPELFELNLLTGRRFLPRSFFRLFPRLLDESSPRLLLSHNEPQVASSADDERQRLAATVFDNSHEAIMIVNPQLRIAQVNRAFSQITGYRADEVVGQKPSLLSSGRHDEAFYQNMWQSIGEHDFWQGEIWNRRRDGQLQPLWLSVSVVRDDQGTLLNYIGICSDLSEQKKAEERIHRLAHYDTVTDLPNRAMVLHALHEAVDGDDRRPIALLHIGLDRFKGINETLGHAVGDQLLREVARRLTEHLGEGDLLARIGGDEFLFVLKSLEGRDSIEGEAQHLLKTLAQPHLLGGRELFITSSIGITVYPGDADTSPDLLRGAHTALQSAKKGGGNHYAFYDASMSTEAFDRMVMENHLRVALKRQEFLLHFQPQLSTQTGRVVGVEALLRWQHPELGMVSPGQFIPVLEETGLIVEVGEWVIRSVCEHLQRWQADGVPLTRVAFNLSPVQFAHSDLVEQVAEIVEEYAIDTQYLELEITEGTLMSNAEASVSALNAMKAMGLRLSIDDFGTGYSSLNYLKRFPIDTLKIDQSFVRDLTHDAGDAAIAEAVVALGRSLKLNVLAEGVETEAQYRHLCRLGCDEVQGYLYSRPLPDEELRLLLQSGKVLPSCECYAQE